MDSVLKMNWKSKWPHEGKEKVTLCAKRLATEVALERFLSSMCAKVHVEIGFLGKSMIAELTHKRTLISEEKRNKYGSALIQPVNTKHAKLITHINITKRFLHIVLLSAHHMHAYHL